jgi:3-phosphoshikimate 1-carboxyvinyltransferase
MTLQTIEAFGITVESEELSHFRIAGEQHYHATHYRIDADWSSASYWLIAAAIGHKVMLEGLRLDSRQADKALMSFLQAAGCRVTFDDDKIGVDGTGRKAFTVDATHCPDLFPALVTLAAYCSGTSVIHGADRLVHKESHRGQTLQSEFAKLGVRIELDGCRMRIFGNGTVTGGRVSSHNDHRIAMCLAIAGLSAETPVIIDGAEAVAKSYPDFWKHLEELKMENGKDELFH